MMMANKCKIAVLSIGLALGLTACAGGAGSEKTAADNAAKLKVVASFYPMYEFSRQVGGEHADVVALIPAGAEPHDWEPSAKDMALIQEADIFIYNGIVEGWAEQALQSATNEHRVVVKASEGIELMEGSHSHGEEEGLGHEEEHEDEHEEEAGHVQKDDHEDERQVEHSDEHADELDPHVWLDPSLAAKEVENILRAYEQADPANAEAYRNNADAYIAKLKELDEVFRTGLEGVKRKEFVTQHAAFAYLANAYGLEQIPIAGLSPDQEPSPNRMAEIVEFAKEHQVKTIFFETLVAPKVARTIADEIGAKTDVLNPLEGLTEEERNQDLDYIAVMKNNLEALKKALNE